MTLSLNSTRYYMSNYGSEKASQFIKEGIGLSQPWMLRTHISVSENGKRYSVEVKSQRQSSVFQVDGQIICNGNKCDKFIALEDGNDCTAIFVELKGKDISHAIDQLKATVTHTHFQPKPTKADKVRARIVTPGCGPSSASKAKLETAKIRFLKQYNIELRVIKSLTQDSAV